MRTVDYRKYHDLESYLFGEVSSRFRKNGTLSAFDFFCIVIWKANRAKSKMAERLRAHGYDDLGRAVTALTSAIAKARNDRAKMKILVSAWGFRLPMASAILTVLYPNTFTIYDVRVCDVLGNFRNAQYRTHFDALWSEYEEYVKAVRRAVNAKYSLRDKDRWLWGKSFCDQLQKQISVRFEKVREENGTEA